MKTQGTILLAAASTLLTPSTLVGAQFNGAGRIARHRRSGNKSAQRRNLRLSSVNSKDDGERPGFAPYQRDSLSMPTTVDVDAESGMGLGLAPETPMSMETTVPEDEEEIAAELVVESTAAATTAVETTASAADIAEQENGQPAESTTAATPADTTAASSSERNATIETSPPDDGMAASAIAPTNSTNSTDATEGAYRGDVITAVMTSSSSMKSPIVIVSAVAGALAMMW